MDNDNDNKNPMRAALRAIPDGPLYVVHELRLMANAEPPYTDFTYTPAMVRNVWRAAADYLEHIHTGTKH